MNKAYEQRLRAARIRELNEFIIGELREQVLHSATHYRTRDGLWRNINRLEAAAGASSRNKKNREQLEAAKMWLSSFVMRSKGIHSPRHAEAFIENAKRLRIP